MAITVRDCGTPTGIPSRVPIGKILVDTGALSPHDLLRAAAIRQREDARIGDILLAHNMVDERTLYAAIATQYSAEVADFATYPADVRLIDHLGGDMCLKLGVLPWRRVGACVLIASCRPEQFEALRPKLIDLFGPVRLAVVSETALHEALLKSRRRSLARAAETRVAADESCREIDTAWVARWLSLIAAALVAFAIAAPALAFLVLTCFTILTLVLTSALKLAAAIAQARRSKTSQSTFATKRPQTRLPKVSILVPLFREREIAGRLIKRLSRLTYPRELLDICLVVEEDDTVTQAAVADASLPRWMRQIVVPRGAVETKPRALNFALDFCRGSIIGIYDAEDAPEPDQIHKVARHFANAGPEVACVQGILDFYNARTNWVARCFTVEYASWFRVILPGYARLGLVVPLGGTTLFFRREVIEDLGGWDAHNVTEDADLGLRLARHGYRTELINTVTDEEANCHVWPWIKQRSRWLKGYALTWAVHMRRPRRLLRDLGWWRFFGVQVLFLGSLSNFVLAPLLWSFWALPLGIHHPLQDIVPAWSFVALGGLFLLSEAITITIGLVATSTPKHKGLWAWVPTLHVYYTLGTLAALKGLWEVVARPFYWDKTAHGIYDTGADIDAELAVGNASKGKECAPEGPPHQPPVAPYLLTASMRAPAHAAPKLRPWDQRSADNVLDLAQYLVPSDVVGFSESVRPFSGAPASNTPAATPTVEAGTAYCMIPTPPVAKKRRLTFGLTLATAYAKKPPYLSLFGAKTEFEKSPSSQQTCGHVVREPACSGISLIANGPRKVTPPNVPAQRKGPRRLFKIRVLIDNETPHQITQSVSYQVSD